MKKILIVDDEPTILSSLSHLLSGPDTAISACATIEEADSALRKDFFDVVITDIRMTPPCGIEGLELVGRIKRNSPRTDIIVMTSYSSEEIKAEAYSEGASHYYEKPFDVADLVAKIRASKTN